MNLLLFIGSLQMGGSERQVTLISRGFQENGHGVTVVTLYPGGEYWDEIKKNKKVKLLSLYAAKQRFPFSIIQLFWGSLRLRKEIKRVQPDIIYSMLEVTNFIAWLSTRGKFSKRLVWGIRTASVNYSRSLSIFVKSCAMVSKGVPLIIANSQAGLKNYQDYGYKPAQFKVIGNGIDTGYYKPDEILNKKKLKEKKFIIGNVARLNPYKDHSTLIRAFCGVKEKINQAVLWVVGDGRQEYKEELINLAKELGVLNDIQWFSSYDEMSKFYNRINVFVLSSVVEGTPNVLLEAMACQTPVVTTDAGDSKAIAGAYGEVVPVQSPEKLSAAIVRYFKMDLQKKRAQVDKAQKYVQKNYSLKKMVENHEKEFLNLIAGYKK